jgi:phosphosulfolactate synthase (CoM biosynthesis protein A)
LLLLQKLQDELVDYIQLLSDMGVECDQLCEGATPLEEEKLQMMLSKVQKDVAQFKIASTEKQDGLKDALKESEKKKQDLEDYKDSVDSLEKWIEDTKQVAEVTEVIEVTVKRAEEQRVLQQVLPHFWLCV